jgi:hypothetical protein
MTDRRRKLTIYSCGCIEQGWHHKSTINWVWCGNDDCPFDKDGQHRKHKPDA